jgi:hypothetical protein
MTIPNPNKWKAIAILYERTFEIYISLASKIQDNVFPEIVKISKDAMANDDVAPYVEEITETTKEIHQNISSIAERFGILHMDAHKIAGEMYEEVVDLENAAEMYSHSYDYCLDKSIKLYERITKEQKNNYKK